MQTGQDFLSYKLFIILFLPSHQINIYDAPQGKIWRFPITLPSRCSLDIFLFLLLILQHCTHHTHINSRYRPSCSGDGPALFDLQAEKISRRKGLSFFIQYMMIHFIGSEFPDQVSDQVISSVNRDPAETILYFELCRDFVSDGVPLDITSHI